MKKPHFTTKIKVITIAAAVILIAAATVIFTVFAHPVSVSHEDYLKHKIHAGDSTYKICTTCSRNDCEAYVGEDSTKVYVDIFMGNEYFGSAVCGKNDSQPPIYLYSGSWQDNTNLAVVFGYNGSHKYSSYDLAIKGTDVEKPLKYHADLNDTKYVLEIHIYSNKYNLYPDLILNKRAQA